MKMVATMMMIIIIIMRGREIVAVTTVGGISIA
jgi:hypothetical protein